MENKLEKLIKAIDKLDEEFVGVRKNESRVAQFNEILEDIMILLERGIIKAYSVNNGNDAPSASIVVTFNSPQIFSERQGGNTIMSDAFMRADAFSFYVREEDGELGSTLLVNNYWLAE